MIRTPVWFPYLLGMICIVVSFPVEGLYGAALAVFGMVFVWFGYLKSRRNRDERNGR
jgi:Na+/H+-translocating membrane pyrophosphatase